MKQRQKSLRDTRGMASIAVFLLAMVSVLILVANYRLNFAASTTAGAFDVFNSETAEKNGVAQVVKESILAIGETAVSNSGNSLQTEIQNRLSGVPLAPGAAIALNPSAGVPSVPSNPFYPFGMPPNGSPPAYFSPSSFTRPLGGMGALLGSLCVLGPAADMGRLTLTFDRTGGSEEESQTYVVNADLFSVPLTNVDVVAYGLPASGTIPLAAPAVPAGFFGAGVSRLIVTSNSPANDPTAYPDLFASSGAERLPYQYRDAVSFSWNAYEYLWSPAYQGALLSAASLNGAIYNFSFPPSPDQPIPGVTAKGNALTVDCSAVVGSILAVVDPNGIGSVTILGSATGGQPFILLIQGSQTPVVFSGNNNRPAIFYLKNANASFSGDPQIQGALFLDPATTASGSVTWFGHLSFYGPASPLSTLNITMADSPGVKSALAALAPRVLLVSTTATR